MWSAISAVRQLARPVAANIFPHVSSQHQALAKDFQIDWDALHAELDTATALLTSSVAPGSHKSNVDLLRNCNESIVHAVYTLMNGYPMETENVIGTSKFYPLFFHISCFK